MTGMGEFESVEVIKRHFGIPDPFVINIPLESLHVRIKKADFYIEL